MSDLQQFGGDWTIEKLDILTRYLDAYLNVLKKQSFQKIYIDAFAGTGNIKISDRCETAGSAKLALMSQNHFDQYFFIEKDKEKVSRLQSMVSEEFPSLSKQVNIKQGDANTELQNICKDVNWRNSRALLFLDPYATQVSWSTLEVIARTGAFDVWYLFPFSALNRMLRKDGQIDQSWANRINRLLGDDGWMREFYEEDPQICMFAEDNGLVKAIGLEELQRYILSRLETIFPEVANNPRVFTNTKNSPLFLFCFAIANRSPNARKIALRIAEYILGQKR